MSEPIDSTDPARKQRTRNEVIIIDDKEEDRVALRATLESCEYKVRSIQDPSNITQFFLAQKSNWTPEAIIVDLLLRGSSGYEVIRNLKPNFKGMHVPIIVVSTLAGHDDIYEASAAGADAFVEKPFTNEQIIEAISYSVDNLRKPLGDRSNSIFVKKSGV